MLNIYILEDKAVKWIANPKSLSTVEVQGMAHRYNGSDSKSFDFAIKNLESKNIVYGVVDDCKGTKMLNLIKRNRLAYNRLLSLTNKSRDLRIVCFVQMFYDEPDRLGVDIVNVANKHVLTLEILDSNEVEDTQGARFYTLQDANGQPNIEFLNLLNSF